VLRAVTASMVMLSLAMGDGRRGVLIYTNRSWAFRRGAGADLRIGGITSFFGALAAAVVARASASAAR
jgi:hypothetical protein